MAAKYSASVLSALALLYHELCWPRPSFLSWELSNHSICVSNVCPCILARAFASVVQAWAKASRSANICFFVLQTAHRLHETIMNIFRLFQLLCQINNLVLWGFQCIAMFFMLVFVCLLRKLKCQPEQHRYMLCGCWWGPQRQVGRDLRQDQLWQCWISRINLFAMPP